MLTLALRTLYNNYSKCLLCSLGLNSILILIFLYKPYYNGKRAYIGNPVPSQNKNSPWTKEPSFEIYLRMNSIKRFTKEYKGWFLVSYRYFFPPELAEAALVIGLDGENPNDHEFGESARSAWPYPKICYNEPSDQAYHIDELSRSFWDQFYPERCIQKKYVGFIHSDTLFSSMVTPGSLFKDHKPIIIAHTGVENSYCWAQSTEYLLGHKQAIQCRSYFPLIFKVDHIIKLRYFIGERFKKSFDQVYSETFPNSAHCLCHFSVICNYLWYYHRDDYHFRLHMGPENWDGRTGSAPGQASLEYLQREFPVESWVPMPRIGIHSRYITSPQRHVLPLQEQREIMMKILKKGRCYSAGFDWCPEKCREFNESTVYDYLFRFEGWWWTWDPRCFIEQQKYYQEVKSVLEYYEQNRLTYLGEKNKEEFCKYLL